MNTVECRSETTYAEKPVAVLWDGRRHTVLHILSRSRTPNQLRFQVQTSDGLLLDLFYDIPTERWDIQPV